MYITGPDRVKDYGVEVAMGLVPGATKVNKFGEAIDCDSGVLTDLWDGANGALSTDVVLTSNENTFTETQTFDSGVSSTVITGGYMSCNTLVGGGDKRAFI